MAEMIDRARGRITPPLRLVTFESSGHAIRVRRMGPTTQREIAASVRAAWLRSDDPLKREPRPPTPAPAEGVIVDVPSEPNYADPDYIKAHAAWSERLSVAVATEYLRYAALALVEFDSLDSSTVDRLRRARRAAGAPIADDPDLNQDENDRIAWLFYGLIDGADAAEVRLLNQALFDTTYPTESEVADALASFRANLERRADRRGDPAPADQPSGDDAPGAGSGA